MWPPLGTGSTARALDASKAPLASVVPGGHAQVHRSLHVHLRHLRPVLVLSELEAPQRGVRRASQSILENLLRSFVVLLSVQENCRPGRRNRGTGPVELR